MSYRKKTSTTTVPRKNKTRKNYDVILKTKRKTIKNCPMTYNVITRAPNGKSLITAKPMRSSRPNYLPIHFELSPSAEKSSAESLSSKSRKPDSKRIQVPRKHNPELIDSLSVLQRDPIKIPMNTQINTYKPKKYTMKERVGRFMNSVTNFFTPKSKTNKKYVAP
jgi:hypothetical protein